MLDGKDGRVRTKESTDRADECHFRAARNLGGQSKVDEVAGPSNERLEGGQ